MDLFETLRICCGHIKDVHVGFLVELKSILTELQPFGLSHFRQLHCISIVAYGVCVINSYYSFQWIILKPCILVVDILKMCM